MRGSTWANPGSDSYPTIYTPWLPWNAGQDTPHISHPRGFTVSPMRAAGTQPSMIRSLRKLVPPTELPKGIDKVTGEELEGPWRKTE